MNLNERENSLDLGEPVTLFRFAYGPEIDDVYCYTDAEEPLVAFGQIFYPRPIEHSDLHSSGSSDKSTFTVRLPREDDVAELFRVYPPSFPVAVSIWSSHGLAGPYALQQTGKVLSCSRQAESSTLTCEPATVSLRRVGLRRHYQYMCPHVLYGPECRANKAAATVNATAENPSGRLVLLDAALTNQAQYAGGLLQWTTADGQNEYRTILKVDTVSAKSQLTVSGILRGMVPGTSLEISKGCPHTLEGCRDIHDNAPNYGGQPFIPTKNPLGRTTPFL